MRNLILNSLCALGLIGGAAACSDNTKDRADRAAHEGGEATESAGRDMEEGFDEAADDTGEAFEDAAEDTEDAAEDVAEDLDNDDDN